MHNQKKLIDRMKLKTDNEKLTINSQIYFITGAAVLSVSDMIRQKSSLLMAWLEGESLKTKVLYEPEAISSIERIIAKREKEAMLVMMSDSAIVVVSSKDPKGIAPQVIKPQAKA